MAQEFVVRDANRKMKRDINKVFSNNFLKILTEILLNSDDSYKRIEAQTGDASVKEIFIDITRGKNKKVVVTDYAEGLDAQDFQRIFIEYGAQHNLDSESNIRGLFGQGASDVLFFGAQVGKLGQIQSIKDDALHVCRFMVKDDKRIKVQTITNKQQIKQFREKYLIENNGTVVSFSLGQQVSIPHKNQIKEKIEKFYMLRYLLQDPRRRVMVRHDKLEERLSSKRFMPKEDHKVFSTAFDFDFEDYRLHSTLTLYEDKDTDVEEKVLVMDDKDIVYDHTLFGLDEASGASRIKGFLVIEGLYDCLSDYLNKDQPKEYLRDSRDGFDMREEFGKALYKVVKPYVVNEIKKLNQAYEPKQFSMDRDKRILNVLRKINDYYKDLKLEEIGNLDKGSEPPSEGLRFVRPNIYITKNKTYDLKLLINPTLISSDDIITISTTQPEYLQLTTKRVLYKTSDIDAHGLVIKSVVLKGVKITDEIVGLKASTGDYESETAVNVVKETVIYPENGLEFIPREMRVKPHKASTLNLYVDLNRFPLGSEVFIERTTRSELIPEFSEQLVTEEHLINEGLAKVPVPFKGGKDNEFHHYKANIDDTYAKAMIRVEEPKVDQKGLEGLFSGLEAEHDSVGDWQSKYQEKTGKIVLNVAHIINQTLLNEITPETLESSNFTKEQYHYIDELVCLECAKQIVHIKLQRNELENRHDVIQKEVQKHKTRLFKSIVI